MSDTTCCLQCRSPKWTFQFFCFFFFLHILLRGSETTHDRFPRESLAMTHVPASSEPARCSGHPLPPLSFSFPAPLSISLSLSRNIRTRKGTSAATVAYRAERLKLFLAGQKTKGHHEGYEEGKRGAQRGSRILRGGRKRNRRRRPCTTTTTTTTRRRRREGGRRLSLEYIRCANGRAIYTFRRSSLS